MRGRKFRIAILAIAAGILALGAYFEGPAIWLIEASSSLERRETSAMTKLDGDAEELVMRLEARRESFGK